MNSLEFYGRVRAAGDPVADPTTYLHIFYPASVSSTKLKAKFQPFSQVQFRKNNWITSETKSPSFRKANRKWMQHAILEQGVVIGGGRQCQIAQRTGDSALH